MDTTLNDIQQVIDNLVIYHNFMLVIMFFFTSLFRAIFWFESNYEKLMPEKIEEASECVELLILQKQLKVQFFALNSSLRSPVINIKLCI